MMDAIKAFLDQNDIYTSSNLLFYWDGLIETIQLVFLSLIIGLVIAIPLSIIRQSKAWYLNGPVWLFTYVFRGTPLLIQLYIIYYGIAYIEGIQESPFWVIFREAFVPCLIAFVLNTAAYTTEIFRGAIANTPKGEIEAASAFGMSRWKQYQRIILPSAFRRALPAYSNEVIFMLHASAIASTVTIMDITGAARYIYARYYAPFEAFLLAAAIYLVLTFALVYLFKQLEKRLLVFMRPRES